MSDLTTRLRKIQAHQRPFHVFHGEVPAETIYGEAAARIEALEARIVTLQGEQVAGIHFMQERDVALAVIAQADERLHAASIPLGMSELAFAQATIRDVHAILSASRVPQGAAEPSDPEQGLLTEAQALRLLHAVEDSAINEKYTDAVVEDLAVYFMDYHDPRGWPIGQTIRNRYQAIKDGSPVRDRFPEQYDAEEGAK